MDPIMAQNPDAPPRINPTYPVPSESLSGPDDFPLRAIVSAWCEKIKKGIEVKEKQFSRDARECMKFFNGPYDFMYKSLYSGSSGGFSPDSETTDELNRMPAPAFRMTCNKVAEAVQLFGPVLYHRNPHRQANPRKIPTLPFGLMTQGVQDPMMMQVAQFQEQQLAQQTAQSEMIDRSRAALMEWMLNYTPNELGLKHEARMSVVEALIKGAGVLWLESHQPKGSQTTLFGSFHDTIDNLIMDPDAERMSDCKWIARRRIQPVWEVEKKFGLPPGSLRAQTESFDQQATVNVDPDGDYNRKRGLTNDLFTYYEVYSKMGVGGRLSGVPKAYAQVLEQFGDFAYLCVADGTFFPLNVPNQVAASPNGQQDILQRLEWPTPVWMDDAWPCSVLSFHWVPRQLWPMSHFKPAMGELKFLNWAYSFLISKIRLTCRDFIAIKKSAGDEIKNRILHGADLTLIDIEATHPGSIAEIVQFLQHPTMNRDIWQVIQEISQNFDKRTGLTELMYGQSAVQLRSASEANLKSDAMNVRPDDMANKVEDWMSEVAKLEAIAIHWHMRPEDIAPLMGPAAAFYWGQLISASNPYEMTHQLQYTIEANSTKKANRDRDAANFNQAMQNLAQPYFSLAMQGIVEPFNALVSGWAKSMDLDPAGLLIPTPPPPPPPPGPGEESGGGDPNAPPAQG